jgi:hypothetical protein
MMNWLQRLLGRQSDASDDGATLWLEVRCGRCGETLRIRVDTRYELRQDVESGQDIRVLDKDLLGTRCFALLHVHAVLTPELRVLAHEVTGGELISLGPGHAR